MRDCREGLVDEWWSSVYSWEVRQIKSQKRVHRCMRIRSRIRDDGRCGGGGDGSTWLREWLGLSQATGLLHDRAIGKVRAACSSVFRDPFFSCWSIPLRDIRWNWKIEKEENVIRFPLAYRTSTIDVQHSRRLSPSHLVWQIEGFETSGKGRPGWHIVDIGLRTLWNEDNAARDI
jgi:hypothetical protein